MTERRLSDLLNLCSATTNLISCKSSTVLWTRRNLERGRMQSVGRLTANTHSSSPPLKSLPPTVERKKRRFSCVLIYIVKRSFLRRIPEFKHWNERRGQRQQLDFNLVSSIPGKGRRKKPTYLQLARLKRGSAATTFEYFVFRQFNRLCHRGLIIYAVSLGKSSVFLLSPECMRLVPS